MTTSKELPENAEVVDTDDVQTNSANFRDQSETSTDDDDAEKEDLADEPLDDDGDPTGEHDHQQDDNYALGGHVTRSGSV